jgi:heat-inducible transcriptional repressor
LVEAFLASGEPVGSRTLSQRLPLTLSPASIRNVMADLETMGLLYAPHTSAGRVPTEKGLRLFVDGLLEVGDLEPQERGMIEARMSGSGRRLEDMLTQATTLLSGLSRCAGLVVTAKQDAPLKHVEFVHVGPGKALVIMVSEDGQVENRVIDTPVGLPVSALVEASNYLNARLAGRNIDRARAEILAELESDRATLDSLTAKIVAEGLATLADPGGGSDDKVLIVRGASHLLDSVEAQADIERIRTLFDDIERKADLIRLLELAKDGDGVRIFIGSENRLFSLSGSSIVAAPYANAAGKIVGVIGVLGPTRLNYGRIIPMVDHTAKVIGRLLG